MSKEVIRPVSTMTLDFIIILYVWHDIIAILITLDAP